MSKKLTTEKFIEKANKIHGNKYCYANVIYTGSQEPIEIICGLHGSFKQKPNTHLNGRGCYKCGHLWRIKKQSLTTESFIEKAKKIHGDKYEYSLVEYINNKTKVKIICSTQNNFEIKPNDHLNGSGCPRCVGRGKTNDDFFKESYLIHGNTYDYSLVDYKSTHSKIKIICVKHGVFSQTPNHHLSGAGCPICNESKGEKNIRLFLENNNIKFNPQHRFKDCRDVKPLPFDFYLPDHNLCIEYQGEQHFKPVNYFGGVKKFEKLKKRDNIKKEYCNKRKIKLLIVEYLDNIECKLKNNVC